MGRGAGYDQLSVTGQANLNGTLNVSVINGFMPMFGDSFVILRFGSRNEDFQTKNGLQLGDDRFDPRYQAGGLTLAVVSASYTINEFPIPTPSSDPFGITACPSGSITCTDPNIWFTEVGRNQIGRITPAGVITEFPIPGSIPWGITFGPDGNFWFADLDNNIGRITPDGLITIFPVPTPYSGPEYITAGPDGNLWFTEPGVNQIGRSTPGGDITEFRLPFSSKALCITAGPDGNVWFTENGKIGRSTLDGVITEFPTPGINPQCITAGPDGNLWFTESNANQIGRITPGGDITEFPFSSGGGFAITLGPDGNLWFIEASQVGRITPDGVVTKFPTFSASFLYGITAGPDGNVWFTEADANQIGQFVLTPTAPNDSRIATGHPGRADLAFAKVPSPGQFGLATELSLSTWLKAVNPSFEHAQANQFFAATSRESQAHAGSAWPADHRAAVAEAGDNPVGLAAADLGNLPDPLLLIQTGLHQWARVSTTGRSHPG